MTFRTIIFTISILIVAALVSGAIYLKWSAEHIPSIQRSQQKIQTTNSPTLTASPFIEKVLKGEAVPSTLGDLVVQPLTITAGIPTTVFVEIFILNPDIISGSIHLDKVDNQGNSITALGILRDDGQKGDIKKGDKRFSAEFTLNDATDGIVHLRASTAFKNFSSRVYSKIENINVLPFVSSTVPEKFVQNVTSILMSAHDVQEVFQFFDSRTFSRLQKTIIMGTTLHDIAQIFQTAHLNWKTDDSAEFNVTITRLTGEKFSALLVLRKNPESQKWQIVEF